MTQIVRAEDIRGRVDFAIITIREDEFEAVLKRLSPRYPVIDGKQVHEYCPLRRADGQSIAVTVVRAFDQGQGVAQSVARDAIDDLAPRWLILTGIAGGVPNNEFSLGDVLLASSLHDFSITAAIEDEQPQYRPTGGPVHRYVERLLAALPAWRDRLGNWNHQEKIGCPKPPVVVPDDINAGCYYGEDTTKEAVRNSLQMRFPQSGCVRPPRYKSGAVATANVLLKDTALLAEWCRCARHITHVEMEAGGVYLAARHAHGGELPLLCIRGISDIVGFKRDAAWTQYACDTAASFLHALLMLLPLDMFHIDARTPPSPSHAPTLDEICIALRQSSAKLVNRVIAANDRIPLTEEATLEQFVSDGDARVLCVLGSPGCGKTSLLALVAQRAIDQAVVTFGIRADLISDNRSFERWSRDTIGLNVTALDAVKAVSSRSPVLVIVDQLDALASTVDLTSDRLNGVLEFINQCSLLPGVSVICSCRKFDFHHDTRFASMDAKTIQLELPSWDAVAVQLESHGIKDAGSWPQAFREVLRTPQHLRVYLDRFSRTGCRDPFPSYQLMLDDLWTRAVSDSAEREFLYELIGDLIDREILWMPCVCYEDRKEVIDSLEAKEILQSQDGKIGFRHQTLLEHAKARLFTKDDRSLVSHVLARQDAVMVRPTVWAVLQYLRDVHEQKYQRELEGLFEAQLRLHLRYLLIEFLGQLSNLKDYEIAILGTCLVDDKDQGRVLIAIRGNLEWFHAFRNSLLPIVMRRAANRQWPVIEVITGAWDSARDDCLGLIEVNWLPSAEKDEFTWRALAKLDKWDERAVEMVCTLVRRSKDRGNRLWWAEHLTLLISADRPKLAPRVFVETVSRRAEATERNGGASERRTHSPLESWQEWYGLPTVAEAAPKEFLREAWSWLVEVCNEYHTHRESTILYEYTGSCFWLDERSNRPDVPVLTAFCKAIDAVAQADPRQFVEITKTSWSSESAVLHRLVTRGLCFVVRDYPDIGMEYLRGDRRRFHLGSHEGHEQSDSVALIHELAPRLSEGARQQLEEMILSWSMYRDDIDQCERQTEWDREARLRLLAALPPDLLSSQTRELFQSEKAALPHWDHQLHGVVRSGFVRERPPMTKEDIVMATNDEVLAAINASRERGRNHTLRDQVHGGWEVPGGAHSLGLEIGELAKEDPQRAVELIKVLVVNGYEDAAVSVIDRIAGTSLSDTEVFALARVLVSPAPRSDELRASIARLLHHRCKPAVGLPDHLCEALEEWLSQPSVRTSQGRTLIDSQDKNPEERDVQSVLWDGPGGLLDVDQSFWPLIAVTHGYLQRSPAATERWLDLIDRLLECGIAERTWASYCSELRWIRLKGCDHVRGAQVVTKLFECFPGIGQRQEGIRLVAHLSDLLPAAFVRQFLDSLRVSERRLSRQAYGELLTLIAFREEEHGWARERFDNEILASQEPATQDEPVAVGMAFAAAHLWDEPDVRTEASRALCGLIPGVTERIGQAIGTVFWAREDFSPDDATKSLLQVLADHPNCFLRISVVDLIQHLAGLLPHERHLVLSVCSAILTSGRQDSDLFEAGPTLVKIAMTLQRFSDTRSDGLSLLETLLQLGLDDAFRMLREIDIRPGPVGSPPRQRRRRQAKE